MRYLAQHGSRATREADLSGDFDFLFKIELETPVSVVLASFSLARGRGICQRQADADAGTHSTVAFTLDRRGNFEVIFAIEAGHPAIWEASSDYAVRREVVGGCDGEGVPVETAAIRTVYFLTISRRGSAFSLSIHEDDARSLPLETLTADVGVTAAYAWVSLLESSWSDVAGSVVLECQTLSLEVSSDDERG